MSKNSADDMKKYFYTQNREISWLRFNNRVLEEAADETVPLMERLKFISIFTSNLDEFFMVRVGSLFDLSAVSPEDLDSKTGMTPKQQLDRIYGMIPDMLEKKDMLYRTVSRKLQKVGICDLDMDSVTQKERRFIERCFKTQILPILSPQIVDSHHPFPHLTSKSLYIASLLHDKKGNNSLGLVPVPSSVPAFIEIPDNKGRYVRMENIILSQEQELFGRFHVEDSCVLCVTRNADISFDEEKFEDIDTDDFRSQMSKLLKKRSRLSIIRLELDRKISDDFLKLLKKRIRVEDYQIYTSHAPLNMKYVFELEEHLPKDLAQTLYYTPFQPRWPGDLDEKRSMIDQIQKADRLLFFPFDKVDPFLRLLNEAADRPDVLSVKITIYRLASTSKVAHALCRAAENGKEVTVLMELRARFDEENNINWSKVLEDSGCRIIYGVEGLKCHSKICLITMRQGERLSYISQLGTGNYNEKTNKMYTDLSLLTADPVIGLDGTVFFQNMLLGNLEGEYEKLLVAPNGIRSQIIRLIEEESKKGSDGYIFIKANAMTERSIIDQLAKASQAGVHIDLVLRGICCVLPGIEGYTEHIHVTSIVGRFLEHARIYCFGRGEDAKMYISSADMMTRNLRRRVEIACPVCDPAIRQKIWKIVKTELDDNVKASEMLSDGTYRRKSREGLPVDSQAVFMETSLHDDKILCALPASEENHPVGGFMKRVVGAFSRSQSKNRSLER